MKLLSRLREISYFARVLVKRAKYTNRQKNVASHERRDRQKMVLSLSCRNADCSLFQLREKYEFTHYLSPGNSLSKLGSLRTCFTSPYIRVNLVACLALRNKLLFSEEKLTTGIRVLIKIHILKI